MTSGEAAIVIVAAGRSVRFGSDKLEIPLAGLALVERAVGAIRAALPEAPCAVVVPPERVEELRPRWSEHRCMVVAGGVRRQDSVRHGVEALAPGDDVVVVIHDGARPFVPTGDTLRVVQAASDHGAALLVGAVTDTVKRVDDGVVTGTVEREGLVRALTPQAFTLGVLRHAWTVAEDREWTDESALVESVGGTVVAVPGDPRNVKVTRPEDVELLRALMAARPRVGQGFDVHRFADDRPLWLCGVKLGGERGLAGHSDADVGLHAVTDAILGACCAGDIGEHFPPSDERWRDASSELFVHRAVELAAARGLVIAHCDVTLLLEAPRIGPHRGRMRARVAELLGVGEERVSIKATTTESLGFVGRGEGAAALAVVTLEAPPVGGWTP